MRESEAAQPLKKERQSVKINAVEMSNQGDEDGPSRQLPKTGSRSTVQSNKRQSIHGMASRKSSRRSIQSQKTIPNKPLQVGFCSSDEYVFTGEELPGMLGFYQEWSSGLWSCTDDCCSCMMVLLLYPFCAPWRLNATIDRVGAMHLPLFGRIDGQSSVKWMIISILIFPVFPFLWLLLVALVYRGVATRYDIPEGVGAAYAKACCCSPLVILQSAKHADAYFAERGVEPPEMPLIGTAVKVVPHYKTPTQHTV